VDSAQLWAITPAVMFAVAWIAPKKKKEDRNG
jgi:ACR3 family arsenite efflux pump ArsB